MTRKPSILAFAPGAWGRPEFAGSPRYHLWTLAGMGWRVLYVEPPTAMRLLSSAWKADDREFHVLSPGRVMPFAVRKIPSESTGNAWRRRTASQLADRALAQCRKLGIAPDICWLGAPWHSAIPAALPEGTPAAYHVYDELPLSPIYDEAQRTALWNWETELLRECAVTLCSSRPQLERRAKAARRAALLENAVRDEWLDEAAPPPPDAQGFEWIERVRAMPRPVFVYGGVVDARLDMRCFDAVRTQNPGCTLVFAGHQDDARDTVFFERHEGQPDVVATGRLAPSVLFAICREADVLLIAHRRSPFTDAMLPEKLNEYLATGRPIVSIGLPEVARVAAESENPAAVRLAQSPAEFGAQAREAAMEDDPMLPHERRRMAAQRTWSRMGAVAESELLRALGRGA